jgi:DNA-binding response OmpR family regulator
MKDHRISQTGQRAGAALRSEPNSPQRILVVDEDSDLCQLYATVLARPGCHVDVSRGGAAAWEALQTNHYSLLITENEMPDLTGVELVKTLRAARMTLPVIMAAGRLPTFELAQNASLQLAATLAKPFVVDELLDTVKKVLCSTEGHREQIYPLPDGGSQPLPVELRAG